MAAEGQRATSTDQIERKFSWVVVRAEPCGDGLRAIVMTNEKDQTVLRRFLDRAR